MLYTKKIFQVQFTITWKVIGETQETKFKLGWKMKKKNKVKILVEEQITSSSGPLWVCLLGL